MTNINLTELDFDGIKNNLSTYMKSQSNTLDFDWDGSISNTLLDLLSYNTMYYAFYSNMLVNESFIDTAQRIESIISLSRPFDSVLPHKSSAKAILELKNQSTTDTITVYPYKTAFTGVGDNGMTYLFYYAGGEINENLNPNTATNETWNEFQVAPGKTTSISVYQAKEVVEKFAIKNFKNETQNFNLNDKSIDIDTLRIYVQESDGTYQYYKVINGADTSSASRVYTLSTTPNGYTIYFGGTRTSSGSFVGRGVGNNEQIFCSYLRTSGSIANGAKSFKSGSKLSVTNPNTVASGGVSSLNINTARYMAIRGGAAHNEKLVTKSDYENYILGLNRINVDSDVPTLNVSVYGSNESAEKTVGTIHYSVYDKQRGILSSTSQTVLDIAESVSNKTMAGLKFLYKSPTEIDWTLTLADKNKLSKFYADYTTGFNQTILGRDVGWTAATCSITRIDSDQYKFDIKNKLTALTVKVVYSGSTETVTLDDGNLKISGITVGSYNLTTGAVSLDSSLITSIVSIEATVDSTLSNLVAAKNENLATFTGN